MSSVQIELLQNEQNWEKYKKSKQKALIRLVSTIPE